MKIIQVQDVTSYPINGADKAYGLCTVSLLGFIQTVFTANFVVLADLNPTYNRTPKIHFKIYGQFFKSVAKII